MKTVLLTGATGGLGQVLAQRLSAAGYRLLLVGRKAESLQALAATLTGPSACLVADLAGADFAAAVLAQLDELGWPLDILINNAGQNDLVLFESQGAQQLTRMMSLNLVAPMVLTQALLPRLAKDGHIINVGSALGFIGHAGYVSYCASKAGLKGFSEALRRELADTGIAVSYLAPRALDTPMNGQGARAMNASLGSKMDSPQVVAKALLTLLESRQGQLVVGQPEAFFSRLNGLAPALVDKAMAKKLSTIKSFLPDEESPR